MLSFSKPYIQRADAAYKDWMRSLAEAAELVLDRWSKAQKLTLREGPEGTLFVEPGQEHVGPAAESLPATDLSALASGSIVTLILHSDRFLVRTLELPDRATEFLPSIVKSQIERLMPWRPDETAFGWSEPAATADGRLSVTVAGTSLDAIKPFLTKLAAAGARSIRLMAQLPESSPIEIHRTDIANEVRASKLELVFARSTICVGALSAMALLAFCVVDIQLSNSQDRLSRELSQLRGAASKAYGKKFGQAPTYKDLLARKLDEPFAVLTLEALSKTLPDGTYVTDLEMDGTKVRLSGESQDATSLIPLLEKSGEFSHTAFFAPTTRSSTATARDHFHIESVALPQKWSQP